MSRTLVVVLVVVVVLGGLAINFALETSSGDLVAANESESGSSASESHESGVSVESRDQAEGRIRGMLLGSDDQPVASAVVRLIETTALSLIHISEPTRPY